MAIDPKGWVWQEGDIKPWRWQEGDLTVTRTTPWTGPGCHNGCGLLVYTKGNEVIKVEGDPDHPFNQGVLCPRCLMLKKVVHHPERLKYPLKRLGKRGEDKWQRIGWDEAYDMVVENVRSVQEKYGPESIAALGGTGRNYTNQQAKLTFSGFGSPNAIGYMLSGVSCYAPKIVVTALTHGDLPAQDFSQGFVDRFHNPQWKCPECIIVWGSNPHFTNMELSRGDWLVQCMKRGSKLIVLDPRVTWLSAKAEIFLQLRPGTDAAIALAMLNVIINEGLYDHEFVENWTHGFDALKERVQKYLPGEVAKISWVPEEKIVGAARLFAKSKPAAIQWGNAIEQQRTGIPNCQAISQLWAITGNLEVPGGMILGQINTAETEHAFAYGSRWGIDDLSEEVLQKRAGWKDYPILKMGLLNMTQPDKLAEMIIEGKPYPIKMAWVQATNPLACTAQEPKKLLHAFKHNLDFIVVADLFMTPTAMIADLILPVCSALERKSFRFTWGIIDAVNPVIDKLWECKSDEEILLELGKRLNPQAFPWESVDDMLTERLKPFYMTMEEIREKGPLLYKFEYEKHKKGRLRKDRKPGFETPTGKVELYCTAFEQIGLDPLPYYEEPPDSPYSTPENFKEYPLIFTNGARSPVFFHSEHRQISEAREIHPNPVTEIHPDDANQFGINDGDWIWIENQRGKFKQVAKVTPGILSGVVHSEHGWWFPEKPGEEPCLFGTFEANPNNLIPFGHQGPSGFSSPTRTQICKVYKAEE